MAVVVVAVVVAVVCDVVVEVVVVVVEVVVVDAEVVVVVVGRDGSQPLSEEGHPLPSPDAAAAPS
eukprot:6714837-Pyramimonas_sp.AAC.1